MAKRQKVNRIKDIQKALLSNVGEVGITPENDPAPEEQADGRLIELTEESYKELQLLAAFQKTSIEELVEMAIGDLLALRYMQIRMAREALESGEPVIQDSCNSNSSKNETDKA